jgi:hypothetical protein
MGCITDFMRKSNLINRFSRLSINGLVTLALGLPAYLQAQPVRVLWERSYFSSGMNLPNQIIRTNSDLYVLGISPKGETGCSIILRLDTLGEVLDSFWVNVPNLRISSMCNSDHGLMLTGYYQDQQSVRYLWAGKMSSDLRMVMDTVYRQFRVRDVPHPVIHQAPRGMYQVMANLYNPQAWDKSEVLIGTLNESAEFVQTALVARPDKGLSPGPSFVLEDFTFGKEGQIFAVGNSFIKYGERYGSQMVAVLTDTSGQSIWYTSDKMPGHFYAHAALCVEGAYFISGRYVQELSPDTDLRYDIQKGVDFVFAQPVEDGQIKILKPLDTSFDIGIGHKIIEADSGNLYIAGFGSHLVAHQGNGLLVCIDQDGRLISVFESNHNETFVDIVGDGYGGLYLLGETSDGLLQPNWRKWVIMKVRAGS